MKKATKLFTLALSATLIGALVSCGSSYSSSATESSGTSSSAATVKDIAKVQAAGKLVVGITYYEPMDYQVDGSTWIGFDADLANEFAKRLNVNCEFVEINWDDKTIELNSGNIDLIWNGMTADEELDKSMDFSVAYSENSQCVVVKKGSADSYDTIDELKKASVAVENGSAGNNVADDNGINVNAVATQKQALMEVVANQSDAAIIDYTMAYSVVGKDSYANLEIVDTSKLSFEREVFAVGLRSNSDMIAEVNQLFKEKYQDGSLSKLAEQYGVALNTAALAAL